MRYDQLTPGQLFIDTRREIPGICLGACAVMFGGSPSRPYPYKMRVDSFAPVSADTWAAEWGNKSLDALEPHKDAEQIAPLWAMIVEARGEAA